MPDFYILQNFHFLRPYWLFLIIPLLIIIKSFYQSNDSLTAWRKVMSAEILLHLTVSSSKNNKITPSNVMIIIAFLSLVIAAGPSWQRQQSPFVENESAVVIALDVSESMNQGDIQPSRLLRAKQKIIELLELRGDSNTALIAFSGSAHTVIPVTNDNEMIRHFLNSLNSKLMPKSGKLPETILPLAEKLLQSTQVPGTLLVLGDGATSETAKKFAHFFETSPHQLIYWAIGNTSQADINNETQPSIIPLQLSQLEALTEKSHGKLVLISHDKQDLAQINHYIENNFNLANNTSTPWHDASYPLVFIMSLCFLLWFRRGWSLQW